MMFSGQDDPESFKVVHCGLDLDRYPYRQPRLQVERLFCVARLSPEKGLTFLIQALKLLINRGIQLDLALAGDGPSTGRLKDLARELGVSDRIQFLGYLPEDDVVRELQKSDLFVLPSLVEGLPVSAMEAMAVGVPVIATNIAGTSELVEHGKSGILVRPSDAHALAEAISSLIENYEFRRNAAELARKKVVAEFKIDDETAKLHACFLQACEPGTSHKITDPILGVNG
jgi:glycosyltransferase involved in cell wall biosynthesis